MVRSFDAAGMIGSAMGGHATACTLTGERNHADIPSDIPMNNCQNRVINSLLIFQNPPSIVNIIVEFVKNYL